jgi:NAD(P)H-flavin reductase
MQAQCVASEFFGQVCDALNGIEEVLAVGPSTGLADFRRYVEKYRPDTAHHVVGFETADHPTDKQLVALARRYLLKYDRLHGVPCAG